MCVLEIKLHRNLLDAYNDIKKIKETPTNKE